MAWVYLDDQFPDHPKIVLAGGDAGWLWACGLAYVRRYATGGLIPKGQVPKLSDRKNPTKLARRLVEVGLWEDRGDHYAFHDYEGWNKPAESRSDAGRKAAKARWAKDAKRNANADADASESHSETGANADANGHASECPIPIPIPLDTDLPPPTTNAMAVDNPVGEGFIDQAVALAATRYANNQVEQGKGTNPDGLARWWTQENAAGARIRADQLLTSHDLTVTQLADALGSHNPTWLNAYRRRDTTPTAEPGDAEKEAVRRLAEQTRQQLRQPGAPSQPPTPTNTETETP